MTQRIAPLSPPYEPDLAAAFARVMGPGREPLVLFRTLARNRRVLDRIFAGGFLDRGPLSLKQREAMILATCSLCGCDYEWGVHVAAFADKAGLSDQDVADLGQGALIAGEVGLIASLAKALHRDQNVDDELWGSLNATFAPDQILELIALAGFYHMIAYLANSLRLPMEPGTRHVVTRAPAPG